MFIRKDFLRVLAVPFLIALTVFGIAACGDSGSDDSVFRHGVASGDPLSDRVILWTRVTTRKPSEKVSIEVATDDRFADIVHTSELTATAATDYTVKTDVQGLSPATVYYYRFRAGGETSMTGRTKTLPTGDVSRVTLAVLSCAHYQQGYFNVYGHAARRTDADIDAVVFLGDYIYEYGSTCDGEPCFGTENARRIGRTLPPGNDKETVTLDDYRRRYALYHTDTRLQELHARYPFIAVWDDHETANDAYSDGALNHNEGEGSFEERKAAAVRAYLEWLPVRENRDNPVAINRSFAFGNLVNLIMLETRLLARSRQLDYRNYITAPDKFDAARFRADISSADRTMMGAEQLAWLQAQLAGSNAVWQALGNQVLMGRMTIPASLVFQLGDPRPSIVNDIAALTAVKAKVLRGTATEEEARSVSTVLPYRLDAWDGYPVEREAVLQTANRLDKNLVVLSGDTHNGWANNLKDVNGNQVGVEFATPGVSSGGLEYTLSLQEAQSRAFAQALPVLVDDLVYANTHDRGYMLVTFTPERADARWTYVNTVELSRFEELVEMAKRLFVNPGEGNRFVFEREAVSSASEKTLGVLAGGGNRRVVAD